VAHRFVELKLSSAPAKHSLLLAALRNSPHTDMLAACRCSSTSGCHAPERIQIFTGALGFGVGTVAPKLFGHGK